MNGRLGASSGTFVPLKGEITEIAFVFNVILAKGPNVIEIKFLTGTDMDECDR